MAMIAGIDCERGEKAHGYVAILELPQGPIFPPTRILRMAMIDDRRHRLGETRTTRSHVTALLLGL